MGKQNKASKKSKDKEKAEKGSQGKKNSKKQKQDERHEQEQEQPQQQPSIEQDESSQDQDEIETSQENQIPSPVSLTEASPTPAQLSLPSSPKLEPESEKSPVLETVLPLPEASVPTPPGTPDHFANDAPLSPVSLPHQAHVDDHACEDEESEKSVPEPSKEPEEEPRVDLQEEPEQEEEKEPEEVVEKSHETEAVSKLEQAFENDYSQQPEEHPEVQAEEEQDIPSPPKAPTPPPPPPREAEPESVNVSHNHRKSAEPSTSSPEITPRTQRPSPAPPTARPKTSSPVYGYSQSRSPAPVHSPHYAYTVPYPHPYAPTPIYPNGALHDIHSTPAMAVSVAPHPVRSSTMDGYHSRMTSRGSHSRGHPDYPYGSSYHQPTKPRGTAPTQQRPAENGQSESSHVEGDTIKLLQRIQNVIPDINRLVTSYRDTQTHLSAHVAQSRQIEEQHERSLMEKEFYIDALQAQIQKTAKENAAEAAKLRNRISELRMELGGLQEQHRDIEDSLAELKKANDELTVARTDLEQEISNLQRALQEDKAIMAQEVQRQEQLKLEALAAQKEELEGYFQEIKNEDDRAFATQLQEREQELYNERDSLKQEWEGQMKDLEKSKTDMANEYDSKLEARQGELDTKQAELDEKQAALDARQEELNTTKSNLEAKQAELEAKQTELDAKQQELDATKSDLEAKLTELEAKRMELETKQTELDSKQEEIKILKSELESKISELEGKQHELEEKTTELESKRTELETIQEELKNVKAELEEKKAELESKQAELEKKQQELDAKQAELDDVKEKHAAEIASLQASLEEQTNANKAKEDTITTMTTEQQQKEEAWQKDRESFESQLRQTAEELKVALGEKDALASDGKTREEQLQSIVEEMRQTHDNLTKDRERLKKTLHSLGEATDMKIKGDAFFIDCFGDLSRLIVELSKEFFSYIPIEPPADILAKIPSNLPQFLDNTPASREIRSAYVQHVVSKTLTYRVFQPFLFTLGRRYDKADTFFQMLSIDIRKKSVRREAFWRQQTLKAAYTASDAKQAINVVAAVIVDEIVDHIRHFTDPKHLDALYTSVRKIVKLAAETWRLARVERELIVASMPSADDDATPNYLWDEFIYDSATQSAKEPSDQRTPLLRMLPRIRREPVHEDFLQPEEAEKANPCVYLPGVILYTDSPSIAARKDELSKKATDVPAPADAPAEANGIENQPNNATAAPPVQGDSAEKVDI